MCGISAIWYQSNPDYRPLIQMVEHQRMRGPDKSDFLINGNIGFGFNRLSIVDHQGGSQPKENDRWMLIFNGEVYNWRDLMPMSSGDTVAIFQYLNLHGFKKLISDIEGMFSIVAYDKREAKLYCAVDPFGIKPLYYYRENKVFACASSPGALATLKDKWRFDRYSLQNYLALGATYWPFFEGIERLEGGTYMVVDNEQRCSKMRYFEPTKGENVKESDLLEILAESIKRTSKADVQVSMFLSGGVDSTVTASHCHNINAIHLAGPEERYAKEVSLKYKNTLQVIEPKDYHAKECLEDYARSSGDCSAASIVPYMASKEVAKIGKCAISSNGADELFFGYNRILEYTTDLQINHIFRQHFYKESIWRELCGSQSREFELTTYVEYDLNKTLDFASMCHGLEVRVPYLNKSVVNAALSMNRQAHVNGQGNKSILKKYLLREGFAPGFVNRPKLGFSLFSEPQGYEELKRAGVEFLRDEFEIDPKFQADSRDDRYYQSAAAAFLCWVTVWENKIKW